MKFKVITTAYQNSGSIQKAIDFYYFDGRCSSSNASIKLLFHVDLQLDDSPRMKKS